jgi:hypothetical protein
MSYRKVGGLRFIRVGRLVFSFCISRKHERRAAMVADMRSADLPV